MQQGFQSGGQKGSERNQRPKSSDRCLPSGKDLDKCVCVDVVAPLYGIKKSRHTDTVSPMLYTMYTQMMCGVWKYVLKKTLDSRQSKTNPRKTKTKTKHELCDSSTNKFHMSSSSSSRVYTSSMWSMNPC